MLYCHYKAFCWNIRLWQRDIKRQLRMGREAIIIGALSRDHMRPLPC